MNREPDWQALESVDTRTTRLWQALVGTCAALLLWAVVFPLDVISVAEGTAVPSARLQKVQHLEGGIVRELLIKEGDTVASGQMLVRLEPVSSGADYGEVGARLTALQGDIVRLEAEAEGKARLEYPAEFAGIAPEVVKRNLELFQARRENLNNNIDAQKREIAQREQDIAEIGARLSHARGRHAFAQEQVAIGEKLMASELSNRYEQLERLKEANALKSRIEEDTAALARSREAVGKARASLQAIQTKYDEEVRKELSDARRQIEEMSNRGDKFRDQLSRTELRAPMAGIVKQLYVNNIGAVIPAGGTVLDLVPEGGGIVIEARLPPQDIGFIRLGQKAFVQLSSADATRYGRIEGKVVHVSPDSVTSKETQANPNSLTTYYMVRIETEADHFGRNDLRYELTPGVQVSAGIVTGSRTVLAYLLYPVFRTMPFAMSER